MKPRVLAAFLTLLFLLAIPTPLHAAGPTRYDLKVDLDYEAGVLVVSQEVSYTNETNDVLTAIVFNVTPAHYGAFTLLGTAAQGQEVAPKMEGVVLEVPLPAPLASGEAVTVTLEFRLEVPSPGNLRFGRSQGIIALGNWYPVVSVYRERGAQPLGWDRHPYVDTGDAFFTEAADYDVVMTATVPLTIAHTGTLVEHKGSRWGLQARGVRDFALALSNQYETASTVVEGTTVTAYYLPEHGAGGAASLRWAAEVLRWANSAVGLYPYTSLHVAETTSDHPYWVGQEYPMVIFISSAVTAQGGEAGSYLSYLVVHEVLHQWFYALVGNDQLYEPWLDEALATYLSYEFFRQNYPGVYPDLWQRAMDNYENAVHTWGDRPVDSSIYDYDDEAHYFAIVYRKGAIFLDELRKQMGDKAFYETLREYVLRYRLKVATGADFLSLAQGHSAQGLEPLVQRFFNKLELTPTPSLPTPTVTAGASPLQGTASPTSTPSPASTSSPTPSPSPWPTSTPDAPPAALPEGEGLSLNVLAQDVVVWGFAVVLLALGVTAYYLVRAR